MIYNERKRIDIRKTDLYPHTFYWLTLSHTFPAKNQEIVREAKALPLIVDIINCHAKDYLMDPQTNAALAEYLLAAVGALNALSLKNRKLYYPLDYFPR